MAMNWPRLVCSADSVAHLKNAQLANVQGVIRKVAIYLRQAQWHLEYQFQNRLLNVLKAVSDLMQRRRILHKLHTKDHPNMILCRAL